MPYLFRISLLAVLSILLMSCSKPITPQDAEPKTDSTDTVPIEEKMDAKLLELLESTSDNKEDSTAKLIKKNDLLISDFGISVTITTDKKEDVADISASIEEAGGKVTSSFENTIFAAIPVEFLRELASRKTVWYIAASHEVVPMDKK